MSTADKKMFVEKALPHSWYLVMESLNDQAEFLYDYSCGRIMELRKADGELLGAIDPAHKSVFLLAGFALENAIKAFLVYENPGWISEGKLSRKLRSHDLVELHRLSKNIPYRDRRNGVLKSFADGLESWARYPCSLEVGDTRDEMHLPLKLWLSYRKLYWSYERKLRQMLALQWKGPHGFSGAFPMKFYDGNPPRVPSYDEAYSTLSPSRRETEDYLNSVWKRLQLNGGSRII